MGNAVSENDVFVSRNLEYLVKTYPRQMVVISHGEIFTGEDAVQQAKSKYPTHIPMIMPVPGPEEFLHIL